MFHPTWVVHLLGNLKMSCIEDWKIQQIQFCSGIQDSFTHHWINIRISFIMCYINKIVMRIRYQIVFQFCIQFSLFFSPFSSGSYQQMTQKEKGKTFWKYFFKTDTFNIADELFENNLLTYINPYSFMLNYSLLYVIEIFDCLATVQSYDNLNLLILDC